MCGKHHVRPAVSLPLQRFLINFLLFLSLSFLYLTLITVARGSSAQLEVDTLSAPISPDDAELPVSPPHLLVVLLLRRCSYTTDVAGTIVASSCCCVSVEVCVLQKG